MCHTNIMCHCTNGTVSHAPAKAAGLEAIESHSGHVYHPAYGGTKSCWLATDTVANMWSQSEVTGNWTQDLQLLVLNPRPIHHRSIPQCTFIARCTAIFQGGLLCCSLEPYKRNFMPHTFLKVQLTDSETLYTNAEMWQGKLVRAETWKRAANVPCNLSSAWLKPNCVDSIRAATSFAPQSNMFPPRTPLTTARHCSSCDMASISASRVDSSLSACSFSCCFCWALHTIQRTNWHWTFSEGELDVGWLPLSGWPHNPTTGFRPSLTTVISAESYL